jgi:hypothetical protein
MDRITTNDALIAIKENFNRDVQWMIKAQVLLKLVAEGDMDMEKMKLACLSHSQAMPD